ncbi:MAG: hypothetical protein IT275_12695 [Chitinophagales bacterium]|nr:hypothetical protein [Chitinophagales bacterium]
MPFFFSGGSTIGSAQIVDNEIVDADINASAGIKKSKLEFVGAKVTKTGTTLQNNSNELIIPWDSESYDTDSFHDNSTNNTRLTIPSAGKYLVVLNVNLDPYASVIQWEVRLKLNGSTYLCGQGGSAGNDTVDYDARSVAYIGDFSAGDYIEATSEMGTSDNHQILASSNFSILKLN